MYKEWVISERFFKNRIKSKEFSNFTTLSIFCLLLLGMDKNDFD